jgi:hypothetical protein
VQLDRACGRQHEEDRLKADPARDRGRLLRDAPHARGLDPAWVPVSVPMMSLIEIELEVETDMRELEIEQTW